MLVKFLTHIASQCGCFNPDDEAEINDSHAEEYILLGYAVKVEATQKVESPTTQSTITKKPNRSK